MFVLSSQGNAMYQAVAMLVTLALAMWMLSIHTYAQAANLTSVSDTLSDSDSSTLSNHTIEFTIPAGSAGVPNGATTTITFPGGFTIGSVDFTDIDMATSTGEFTIGGDCTLTEDVRAFFTGQILSLVFCPGDGGSLAAGDTVTVEVGLNATTGVAGDAQITNHATPDDYELQIATPTDSGRTRVVIIDDVLVTASVATVFDFVVSGFPSATGVNVNGTSTTGTSSATALPFGQLSAGIIETLAQRLNVTTNAKNGFVVTVFQSDDFNSTTGADIDSFFDNTYENTPSDWAAPSAGPSDENEWGHWGLTSSDDINASEFQGCAAFATEGCWVAASTTPRQVFAATSSADGLTANVGSTTVGYQVQITSLQEAADDYQTTLTYIATPTF